MWLFTKYGFYSVTCPKNATTDQLQIRSRNKEHLTALQKRFPEINNAEILNLANRDYPYRIIVEKSKFATISQELVKEIDYDNFKDTVHECKDDEVYHEALMDVWFTMYKTGTRNE